MTSKSFGYPRYAYTKYGLVRILHYLGENRFEVVGRGDERRVLHRDALDFRRSGIKRS